MEPVPSHHPQKVQSQSTHEIKTIEIGNPNYKAGFFTTKRLDVYFFFAFKASVQAKSF
jgi:hypothetical protein